MVCTHRSTPSKIVDRRRRSQNEDNEDEQGLLDSATPEEDVSNFVGDDTRHITAVGEASRRLASENPSTANTTVEAAKDRENQVRDYLSVLRCLGYS